MSEFVRNCWYVAALAHEVGRHLFSRTLLGDPVLLYRTEDGAPVALLDQCPHRLTPLSLGKLRGDHVECGYHGMQFDCAGRCVRVPGQARIPQAAKVRRFPSLERYGFIWVWTGDPALADPGAIVDVALYDHPDWGVVQGPYQTFATNYLNITDNLVDPSHTSFVHTRTIGTAAGEEVPVTTTQSGNTVEVSRWIEKGEPVPVVRRFGHFDGLVDRWQYYRLQAPNVSWVDFGSIAAGAERSDENRNRGYRTFTYSFITPESGRSTHYFWFHLRNYSPTDDAVSKELRALYEMTFDEDRAILEAIQRRADNCGEVAILNLAIDGAGIRARRILERMLADENPKEPSGHIVP